MFHQMRGISLFYHRRTLLVRRTEYEGSWDSLDGWIRTLVHELQWNPLFKDRSEGTIPPPCQIEAALWTVLSQRKIQSKAAPLTPVQPE